MKRGFYKKIFFTLLLLAAMAVGLYIITYTTPPPSQVESLCGIFREKGDWYDDTKQAQQRWGMPIAVQMAILRQESRFISNAVPPRTYLLGFIPWGRISTAYGYTQALDGTWNWYLKQSGNSNADRDDFSDSTDFVAWYGHISHKRNGIGLTDSYNQYLAYHEGHTGYKRGSYKTKPRLIEIARKVEAYANSYQKELTKCREELESNSWWPF